MTKQILCALDIADAEPDLRPLKKAVELADLYGAGLDVVTVIPDLGVGEVATYLPPDFEDKAIEAAAKKLREICEAELGAERNAKVRHEVAVGRVPQEVVRAAETLGSDLIVVASHRPTIVDYLIGTNASQIVFRAPCSVYVVR